MPAPGARALGRSLGMTHFVNPKDVKDPVAHIVELTTEPHAGLQAMGLRTR